MDDIVLPIAYRREKILSAIRENQVVMVVGPTGMGKTTQIPQYLIESEISRKGKVVCTEPKRVAAIAAANYVANVRGGQVGQEVGYIVRFDKQVSAETSLTYVTVGILLRQAIHDPLLSEYACVIVDEAHERDVFTDFLLGYLKRICARRPEFKVVIMSATMRYREFQEYFPGAKLILMGGRHHEITTYYYPAAAGLLESAAADVVEEIHRSTDTGDILVFMPGEWNIRQVIDRLESKKLSNTRLLPLFGTLSPSQQRLVFKRFPERKVIVATNIAESSLTIDNLDFVVDSGYAKEEGFDPVASVETLELRKISQASAVQRAGRTGRTGPGTCIRLYSEDDWQRRPKYPDPSIRRKNLTGLVLMMKALGLDWDFDFLTPPSVEQWQHALQELTWCGALDEQGTLTERGTQMAQLALEPKLAHFVLTAAFFGCAKEAAAISAMLTIGRFFVHELYEEKEFEHIRDQFTDPESDFITLLNIWDKYQTADNKTAWCQSNMVREHWMRAAETIYDQLLRHLQHLDIRVRSSRVREHLDCAIAAAFSAHVLRFHRGTSYKNERWHQVQISKESVLASRTPQYVVSYTIRGNGQLYASCNHEIPYTILKQLAPQILNLEARPADDIKPLRLKGELAVQTERGNRTVKVDIDLKRSPSTTVRSLKPGVLMIEEQKFPITHLGLTMNTQEELQGAGIFTLAELPNNGTELAERGIPAGAIGDILKSLYPLWYVRRSSPLAKKTVDSRLVGAYVTQEAPTDRLADAFLLQPIEHLKLSGLTLMMIAGIEVTYVGDLTSKTEKELLQSLNKFLGITTRTGNRDMRGNKVVQEVKSRLHHFGLALKPEKTRGFNNDPPIVNLPVANTVDGETAAEKLGVQYPLFKEYRLTTDPEHRLFVRNKIATINVGLPSHLCRNLFWYLKMVDDPMLEYEDLFQEGCMGLLYSIGRYDYTRGFAFSTYAFTWISQRIFRAIDEATILPVHVIGKLRTFGRMFHRLAEKLGSPPTREEFCDAYGKTAEEVERLYAQLHMWKHFVSADTPVGGGEEGDKTLLDYQESPHVDLDERLDRQKLRRVMEQVLNSAGLQDVEKEIVIMRHGLASRRTHTLEEVGESFGVTRERIRQLEEKALKKLRTQEVYEVIHPFLSYLPAPSLKHETRFLVDDGGKVGKRRVSCLVSAQTATLTPGAILAIVEQHFSVTRNELLVSKRKDDHLVVARRIAIHLLYAECRIPYFKLGAMFRIPPKLVPQFLSTSAAVQEQAYQVLHTKPVAQISEGLEKAPELTAERILDVVCGYYEVPREDVLGTSRLGELIPPRHAAMFLVRQVLKLSYPEIGEIFHRDHTTVMAAEEKVHGELKTVPQTRAIMTILRQHLGLPQGGEK